MGNYLFTNNASTTLAAAISNTSTTVTVASGTAALFPVPNPSIGTHFHATFVKNGAPGTYEIVDVTVVSGDTFTITRAQEGTTALGWAVGDFFNLFPTAAGLMSFAQAADIQSQVQNYAADTGTANAYVVSLTPPLTAHVVGMPIRFKAAHANTGASTFNDGVGTAGLSIAGYSSLPAGSIVANGIYEAFYDGANFQLINAGYIPISLLPNPGSVQANDVVRYDGSGYVFAGQFNQQSGTENPTISQVIVSNGDGYFRKASLSYFEGQMSLSAIGGQVTAGQVPVGAVTQWQASLLIGWGQITGVKNADQLQGLVLAPFASYAGNSIAWYSSAGYLFASYFNQASANFENPGVSQVMVTNGSDGYLRKVGLGSLEAQMSLSSIGGQVNVTTQLNGVVPNTHLPNVGSMPGVIIAADPGTVPSGSPGQVFEYY